MNTASVTNVTSIEAARINASTKRPRPIIRRATPEDLAWEPETIELHAVVNGANVRAGESYAIVRPGMERWPLGIVSDHYRVTGHRQTAESIKNFCADAVTPAGAIIAGHGYAVAHSYTVKDSRAVDVCGIPLSCRLVVASSHTGGEALRASMVAYVGKDAIGAVVHARALHVASQPSQWHGEVDAMVEKAILVQGVLADLLKAANERVLTDADRSFFKGRKMVIKKTARTALDAVRSWMRGHTVKMTYQVWTRRLDDDAIRALVVLLGRDVHGVALDDAMGYLRRDASGQITHGVYYRAR